MFIDFSSNARLLLPFFLLLLLFVQHISDGNKHFDFEMK